MARRKGQLPVPNLSFGGVERKPGRPDAKLQRIAALVSPIRPSPPTHMPLAPSLPLRPAPPSVAAPARNPSSHTPKSQSRRSLPSTLVCRAGAFGQGTAGCAGPSANPFTFRLPTSESPSTPLHFTSHLRSASSTGAPALDTRAPTSRRCDLRRKPSKRHLAPRPVPLRCNRR